MRKKVIGFIVSVCLTAIAAASTAFAGNTSAVALAPSLPETRKMVVTLLFSTENSAVTENKSAFTDIPEGTFCSDVVNWASEKGIVSGYGDGTFRPDENITKEQFAMILYRYAVYKNYDTTQAGMAVREYKDYEKISPWALRAVAWSLYSGIMTGRENDNKEAIYEPQSYITQEYANAVITKFFEKNKTK
jgi:hypothetical protein